MALTVDPKEQVDAVRKAIEGIWQPDPKFRGTPISDLIDALIAIAGIVGSPVKEEE